ncbi:MAG: type VI secretion system baseplate subunit TssF [Akkermansia sp.]
MDNNFLEYYEEELGLIRASARHFAADFPKVASRLQLGAHECPDPYVERLLEGFAFLTARISRKQDSGLEEFADAFMNFLYPALVSPIPSRAVLSLVLDMKECPAYLEKGSIFEASTLFSKNQSCQYTTEDKIPLLPIEFESIECSVYGATDYAVKYGVEATHCLNISYHLLIPFKDIPDRARFFIDLPNSLAVELLSLILETSAGVIIKSREKQGQEYFLPSMNIVDCLSSEGGRENPLIAHYFREPSHLCFFDIIGLPNIIADPSLSGEGTLTFLLKAPSPALQMALTNHSILPNCVCIINQFTKTASRLTKNKRYLQHVVADNTAPNDYEILNILEGCAYDFSNRPLFPIYPFYHVNDENTPHKTSRPNYFSMHRRQLVAPDKQRSSSYTGTEMYTLFSGPDYLEHHKDIDTISLKVVCSNRDLPLFIRKDAPLTCRNVQGIASAHFICPPSDPCAALLSREKIWKGFEMINMKLETMASFPQETLASILSEELSLLRSEDNAFATRQISGLTSVSMKPIARVIPIMGNLCSTRGWQITIKLNEEAFGGIGTYLFARSLSIFLGKMVPLNSFMEIIIRNSNKELWRWTHNAPRPHA